MYNYFYLRLIVTNIAMSVQKFSWDVRGKYELSVILSNPKSSYRDSTVHTLYIYVLVIALKADLSFYFWNNKLMKNINFNIFFNNSKVHDIVYIKMKMGNFIVKNFKEILGLNFIPETFYFIINAAIITFRIS